MATAHRAKALIRMGRRGPDLQVAQRAVSKPGQHDAAWQADAGRPAIITDTGQPPALGWFEPTFMGLEADVLPAQGRVVQSSSSQIRERPFADWRPERSFTFPCKGEASGAPDNGRLELDRYFACRLLVRNRPGRANLAVQLAQRCPQTTARLNKVIDTVAALDIRNRVLPALTTKAGAAPPTPPRRLHAQTISSAAEGAGAGILAAAGARDPLQPRIAADQLKQVDAVFYGCCVDWHSASLKRAI